MSVFGAGRGVAASLKRGELATNGRRDGHIACSTLTMETRSLATDAWEAHDRELERRLVDAAEELLAHRAARSALIPMPGRLPVRCIAIGDLERIRAMVRWEDVSV
jgi:hypothetical protein